MTGVYDSVLDELPAHVPVSYPGVFRPVPPFTIDVPPLWVFGEFPGALFTFGPQPREDGAWVNVLVQHERISPDTNIVDIAQASWAELVENSPDVVLGEEYFLHMQQLHYLRQTEIPPTSTTPSILRFDTWVQHPVAHATCDLFHFTWLVPTEDVVEFQDEMIRILGSFRFD